MVFFLVFLFTDVFVVIVFKAVYGGKLVYSQGMLLGVHIPKYAVEDPEVDALMQEHKKRNKRFYGINFLIAIAINFLCFWYTSIFLTAWMLWLAELVVGAFMVLYSGHKKLYSLKEKRGWYGASGSKIVVVDANDGASSAKPPAPLYVDDDVYWKNGWYNNPNDKRVWVQDRYCNANFTNNLGHPAGKAFAFGTFGLVAVLLIGVCAALLKIDFTPVYLGLVGNTAIVSAPMYAIEFDVADIREVKLLDELPDDSFHKTNGLGDSRQLLGKFSGRKTGPCRLYIQKGCTPVLEVELPEYTVFMNSREEGAVKEWFSMLQKARKAENKVGESGKRR